MSNSAIPIQPVEKGTLFKLWGGVALAVLVAGGIAWAGTDPGGCTKTTASGLGWSVVKPGTGAMPTDQDVVLVNYRGTLADGKEFDKSDQAPFPVAQVVPGFREGLKLMQRGGSYKLCIPAALGYAEKVTGPIPANSPLIFTVDLLDFKSMAELQALQAQMPQAGAGAPPHAEMPAGH